MSATPYTYDLTGNRTGVWFNGTCMISQTHDAADQVVGWTYDAAGNLLDDGTTADHGHQQNTDHRNRRIAQARS